MTKDPENIKAMLATQFNDFGKGRLFHEQWDFVSILVRWKSNYSSLEMVFSMLMVKFGSIHELCCVRNSIDSVSLIYMCLKNMFPRWLSCCRKMEAQSICCHGSTDLLWMLAQITSSAKVLILSPIQRYASPLALFYLFKYWHNRLPSQKHLPKSKKYKAYVAK